MIWIPMSWLQSESDYELSMRMRMKKLFQK